MVQNKATKEDKAYDLILYCKLLKYLRTTTVTARKRDRKIYIFKKVYTSIVKNMCVPYITKSAWTNELCFGLKHHPIYGCNMIVSYNMIVLFKTLKDVKL